MSKFLCAALIALAAAAQTPKPPLEFEVASVKHTVDFNASGLIVHLPGERGYRGVNMPLRTYIRVAYQLRDEQIVAPEWINTEVIDLEGKAGRTCTADELHEMLQHLLEERFHIKLHHEVKSENGYALVVDNGAPKLTDHDPTDPVTQPIQLRENWGHSARNVTMQYFAFYLSQEIGQTVVDKTGLTGHYDFEAKWVPEGAMNMPPPPGPGGPEARSIMMANAQSGPSVADALKKQLGLRLDRTKISSDRLVIDRIEKLTEN